MGFFAKYTKVYEAKGKSAEWKEVRSALKEAGLTIKSDIWQDEIAGCGCGAKLDNRDFGPGGKIDRNIYALRVKEDEAGQAAQIILTLLPDYTPYEPREDRLKMN